MPQSILVRSSVSNNMEMSMLRKVMMDIAVPEMTGGPLASSVEECVCPPEYSGASCEECSEGGRGWARGVKSGGCDRGEVAGGGEELVAA